ncbi:MAG: prepilin-type N-terminal cleavage/methylation domain-containing protein [Armatimonas sp.]
MRRGFTLIETLVAALLLSLSIAAMVTLWGLGRRLTEQSRDMAEHIAVARQEAERDKALLYNGVFINSTGNYTAHNPQRTDYTATGQVLATNLAANAAATTGAYYRAVSTYTIVTTGSETDPKRKLGIQIIQVFPKSGSGFSATASYQTTVFYTSAGV